MSTRVERVVDHPVAADQRTGVGGELAGQVDAVRCDRPASGSVSEVNELALIVIATSSLCWMVLLSRIGWRRGRRSWPAR